MKKIRIFLVVSIGVLLAGSILFVKTFFPEKIKAALNFTAASATLVNSRFSYRAQINSGTSGSPTVTIKTGSADTTTNHLFPGDVVCFTDTVANGLNGCIGSKTYTVSSILTTTSFNLSTDLTNTLLTDGFAIASQSGTLTLTFTTTSEIPIGGDLYITIPTIDLAGKTNDGIPDTAASIIANGFDQGKIVNTDVTAPTTGCTGWGTVVVTSGDAGNDLRIQIPKASTSCPGGNALTVTIGGTHNLINPAAFTGQTQGQANAYQIKIQSRTAAGAAGILDESDVMVAPIEAVLVSATVDETLSLTIAGVTADTGTFCNITRTAGSPDTTATSVPWGIVPSTYVAATNNTNQQITVSTNAGSGYNVFVEENDQMGKNGNVCTGTAPSGSDDYTFSAGRCIRDTVCGAAACTESAARDWTATPGTYVGLGFSLQDTSGDAVFDWDGKPAETTCTTGAFCTRQIADVFEGGETRAAFMHNDGPVAGSSLYVCYRIAIGGTQPAGYYYNKVKYTAVATF